MANVLNSIKKDINILQHEELETFISRHYGVYFDLIKATETPSGFYVACNVDGVVNRFDQIDLDNFKQKGSVHFNTLRVLMNDLCSKGLVEKGQYMIYVYF